MASAAAVTATPEPTGVMYGYVVKRPGFCGGQAALLTRVRVHNIAFWHKKGHTPEQIHEMYPDATLAQIHAALAYYYDHVDEIEADLAANERLPEMIRRVQAEQRDRNGSR